MVRPRLWLAALFLIVPAAGQTAERASEAEREGHERMLALLREIHAAAGRENPYLGQRALERLEKLGAKAEGLPLKTRALLAYEKGQELLRLGREDEAVASLLESHALLDTLPREDWPPFASGLLYDLGVAHLRLGETANCVARHTSRSCLFPIRGDGVHADPGGSRTAMRWLREALAYAGEQNEALRLSALWLLNVAAMTLGEHPGALDQEERLPEELFTAQAEFPRFPEVAAEVGLDSFDLCGGAVADDLDGDGDFDVLSSSWSTDGQLRFFANRGDGRFEERTGEAGLRGLFGGLNLEHADADGDGDLDVLVLRGAWLFGDVGRQPNSLLRNDGGSFLDVTFAAGLGEEHYPTQTAGWADFDLDGDLDLYVGNEASLDERHPSQLFENLGDGTFLDVAAEAGVENGRYAKGVACGDYDGDGRPDLYVSNLASPNRLYHNEGDGTFTDVAPEKGVAWPLKSFPAWFFDYDSDGHLDIWVSSYDQGQPQQDFRLAPVVASALGLPYERFGAESARLYRGDGKGGFTDVAEEAGVDRLTLPMGANYGDLDNDGYLDFYLGTGYPYFDGLIPNVMYWNRGGRRFLDVTIPGGFGHLQKGHAVAFADLDGDGDQDVFEQVGGAYPGDAFANALFRNPGFGNHWLEVRLVGVEENRYGVGARLRAVVEEDGRRRAIHRTLDSGGSFGCNPYVAHLGLGDAGEVERLEIFWPRTGRTQVFENVPADRRIVVVEGEERYSER